MTIERPTTMMPYHEITFKEYVCEATIDDLIDEIDACRQKHQTNICLFINSPGGSLHSAMRFIDYANSLADCGTSLDTCITGFSASAATLMALTGRKRYMTPHALVFVHELSGMTFGSMSQMISQVKSLEDIHNTIVNMYAEAIKRSGKVVDEEEISLMLRQEKFMSAKEYHDMGLVDTIGWPGRDPPH